jgi:hypothetical protein
MTQQNNHIFLALSQPTAGREDEFHRWYDKHHLADVVDYAPGFRRGRRYYATPQQTDGRTLRWESLAIYNIEAEDVAAMHIGVRANVGRFTPSGGVFQEDHVAWVYSPVGEAICAPGWTPLEHGAPARPARFLALAFGDDPVGLDAVEAVSGVARGHQFIRHPDQREGNAPPWLHLSLFEIQSDSPAEVARSLVDRHGAAALWLYQPRGSERMTQPAV